MSTQNDSISAFAVALREARVRRSLSIAEVSKELLLSDKQIVGLENDDFNNFYGASFASKAAFAYASFLEVDTTLSGGPPYPDPDTQVLSVEVTTTSNNTRSKSSPLLTSSAVTAITWVAGGFVITMLIFLIYQLLFR